MDTVSKEVSDRIKACVDELYEIADTNKLALTLVLASHNPERETSDDEHAAEVFEAVVLDNKSALPIQYLMTAIFRYFREHGHPPDDVKYAEFVMHSALESARHDGPEKLLDMMLTIAKQAIKVGKIRNDKIPPGLREILDPSKIN